MSQRSRPARLHDVARAAGVHVSTVSRVINNSGDVAVRPETRERILAAARDLQYRPNANARGLKLAATGALGLLVPSLRNPVNSPIIRGAFDRAWERNFVLLLAEDPGETEVAAAAYARLVEERRIDGVLIQSARLDNPHLDAFDTGLVPCVFMDRRSPGSCRNVSMRAEDAGRRVADHFLDLGHRSLGHLGGPGDLDGARAAAGAGPRASVRISAAVLRRAGRPLELEELELEPPRRDEVLVCLLASGICRSDLSLMDGKWPAPLPMVLGHEGAGMITAVGEAVAPGRVGEAVVLTFTPACGRCRFCLEGRINLCTAAARAMDD